MLANGTRRLRPDRALTAIFALSALARIATSVALGDRLGGLPGTADQVSYHALALRVLSGEGFSFESRWWPATDAGAPTAHWSFLYTFFLTGVYALFGPNPLAARIIQTSIVGILHPLLAFMVGRRVFGETAGLAAAGIAAAYAYFVYYSATLMTEPFYITANLASLYLAIRLADRAGEPAKRLLRPAVGLGLSLGVAVLLRQVILLFVPILLLWMYLASERRLGWIAVSPIAVVALLVLPITLHNADRFGRFVLLNTNAGYAVFWANHPIYGTRFEPILPQEMGGYQDLIPPELRGLDEAALDTELLKRGIGFVSDDPARYLRLSISRIPAYFKFWPSAESSTISNISRVLSFGVLLPFMLYGLFRAWIDRGSAALGDPVGLLTLFVIGYSSIHLLSWSLIRYRLPVDAVLVIFAAYAIAGIARRFGILRSTAIQPA